MKDGQARLLAVLSVIISGVVIFIFFGVSKADFVGITEDKDAIPALAGVGLYDQMEELAEDERAEIEAEIRQYLRISLPEGTKESDIKIEPDYVKKQMHIEITSKDKDYQLSKAMLGDCNHVTDISYGQEQSVSFMDLTLDSVYEYEATTQDKLLIVKFLKPKDVYDKVIVVDAGHGGSHPGTNRKEVLEKDLTLSIVLYLKELLDESDIKVYYTRTDDSNPGFDERVQLANEIGADFFLSVHINADERSKQPNGTEALYYTQDTRSLEFATICVNELSKALNSKNRGVTSGDTIYIIHNSIVPVTLVEVGFLSNDAEFSQLCSKQYQKKAAEGIYNGIVKAYEEMQGEKE